MSYYDTKYQEKSKSMGYNNLPLEEREIVQSGIVSRRTGEPPYRMNPSSFGRKREMGAT